VRRDAYTSTVFGPMNLAIGVLFAALLAAFVFLNGVPWWVAVVAVLLCLAVALHLAVVRLAVSRETVRITSGWWGMSRRVIAEHEIVEAAPVEFTVVQTYWKPPSVRGPATRLTVRAGATLRLTLISGETLWISTADPENATKLINERNSA
jgi:hypothetical protein